MTQGHLQRFRMRMYEFVFDAERGTFHLSLPDSPTALVDSGSALLLAPDIPGVTLAAHSLRVSTQPAAAVQPARILIEGELTGAVAGWVRNEILLLPDRLVCLASYEAEGAHELTSWCVLPPDSRLSAEALHLYAGHHNNPGAGMTVSTDALEVTTASHNWTYCSLSPRVLLKRGADTLAVGGTSIANDYGLEVKIAKRTVDFFRFNYGGAQHPLHVAGGQRQTGPRLQLQITNGLTDHQAHRAFLQAMTEDGITQPKRYRPEDRQWLRPWYCTWGDQMLLAHSGLKQDVSRDDGYKRIKDVLTEDWVLRTARRIRELDLNIGTFIIDDGWQDKRGDWNLVRERFPDMRRMVDALHAMDFRVVIWWAPFLLEPGSVNAGNAAMVSGPDRYGQHVIDYTKPATRDWLDQKLNLWFGTAAGNWNVDGFKLDFLAEKVSPSTQQGDAAWRGEEREFHELIRTLYTVAARYAPSPGILHTPYNPHLLPYATTVFLEERFDTDFSVFHEKKPMTEALMPGLKATAHFNYNPDTARDYLRMCRELELVPQIGVVHGTGDDYYQMRKAIGTADDPGRRPAPLTPAELRNLLADF